MKLLDLLLWHTMLLVLLVLALVVIYIGSSQTKQPHYKVQRQHLNQSNRLSQHEK